MLDVIQITCLQKHSMKNPMKKKSILKERKERNRCAESDKKEKTVPTGQMAYLQ